MRRSWIAAAALVTGLVVGGAAPQRPGSPELRAVNAAIEAMGGSAAVGAVKTFEIHGYGQIAYQDGGGNIDSSPHAPQKWVDVNAHRRTVDLQHGRMRLEQRQYMDFAWAIERNMTAGVAIDQRLDGNLAFNVDEAGKGRRVGPTATRARRIDYLNNPLSLVRVASDPATRLSRLRTTGGEQLIDMVTAAGDRLTFAIDAGTRLPAWVRWTAPHPNYGDTTYQTRWSAYAIEGKLRLPSGYNTVSDFRGVVQNKLYVDKYVLDPPAADLAAPADVASATVPPDGVRPIIEAVPAAPHIWYMRNANQGGDSTLFEFADHTVLFEADRDEALGLAMIAKARELVPSKPVTHLIVSHHHIDHSAGVRAAVSEGLTIITNRENVAFFREVVGRPATQFPDALGRRPRPLKIIPVDDRLTLKDATMTVEVYKVIANSHMAHALLAYAPSARTVSEGDLVSQSWDLVWWGNSYPQTVAYWKLDVDKDLPVHGDIHTWPEVLAMLKKASKNAEALCARAAAARLPMRSCPVSNTLDRF